MICPLTPTVLSHGFYFLFIRYKLQGFAYSQSIGSLTDEINRWYGEVVHREWDTKFRLIRHKILLQGAESDTPSNSHVNYSALVVYEVGEIKKTDDSSEPLEASGVK